MNRPHARTWLVSTVVAALLALAGWALVARPRTEARVAPRTARPSRPAPGAPPPALGTTRAAWRGGGAADASGPPLDCAHPSGNVAMVGGDALTAARFCERLARIGGVGAAGIDRQQARVVLEQLTDVVLVRRALAWERAAVSDAELASALAALQPAGADGGAPVDELLREQTRERLELRKLAGLRHRLEVTEAEVDAEVARGAPGIDRGEGVRVEAWLARAAPGVDGGERPDALVAAEGFALAVQTQGPEAAAARHRLTRLAPFVVGASGMEPELERAAIELPQGRWSGAVRTRIGWVVLRPIARVEGQAIPADVLRARVRRALESRKLQSARQELLASLRAAARTEVLVDLDAPAPPRT